MHNSYYDEPTKTHTCKPWLRPLVSVWFHLNTELKPTASSEPQQDHRGDSKCQGTKHNFRRSKGKILGNTVRLNYYPGKLNVLHYWVILVDTNTAEEFPWRTGSQYGFWISNTEILHRKPPNRVLWQKATVNWQKRKKKGNWRKGLWPLIK